MRGLLRGHVLGKRLSDLLLRVRHGSSVGGDGGLHSGYVRFVSLGELCARGRRVGMRALWRGLLSAHDGVVRMYAVRRGVLLADHGRDGLIKLHGLLHGHLPVGRRARKLLELRAWDLLGGDGVDGFGKLRELLCGPLPGFLGHLLLRGVRRRHLLRRSGGGLVVDVRELPGGDVHGHQRGLRLHDVRGGHLFGGDGRFDLIELHGLRRGLLSRSGRVDFLPRMQFGHVLHRLWRLGHFNVRGL